MKLIILSLSVLLLVGCNDKPDRKATAEFTDCVNRVHRIDDDNWNGMMELVKACKELAIYEDSKQPDRQAEKGSQPLPEDV